MIYFVKNSEGLIKIGYTKDIQKRLSTLMHDHGQDLQLLKCICGTRYSEKSLHKRFSSLSVGKEWFRSNTELIEFIEKSEASDETPEHNTQEIKLGKDVQYLRLMKNMTQKELCNKAGISMSALRHLEGGQGASVGTLLKAASALGRDAWIQGFAPYISINPLHMVGGKQRQRARGSK